MDVNGHQYLGHLFHVQFRLRPAHFKLALEFAMTLPTMPRYRFNGVMDRWYSNEYLKINPSSSDPLWHVRKSSANCDVYLPLILDRLEQYHSNNVHELTGTPFDRFMQQPTYVLEGILAWCKEVTDRSKPIQEKNKHEIDSLKRT